jgi:hypothetical protein
MSYRAVKEEMNDPYVQQYALKDQRHLQGGGSTRHSHLKGSDCLHLRPMSPRYVLEERRKE